MTMDPTVSVVMPVYNAEKHLKDAINSVLQQTLSDFELIIVDDGSTDGTAAVVYEYSDSRIRWIEATEHQGIANVLNIGLAHSTGKYIARMDADDLCAPTRFERQLAYMEAHPDVILCGTNMQLLNSSRVVVLPAEHEAIRANLLFSNCISHPTAFIRRHDFAYSLAYPYAEDYALWTTMIEHGRFHNLTDPLYTWRIHEQQVSTVHFTIGRASGRRIHRELLTRFGVPFTEQELSVHTNFQAHIGSTELDLWLDKLLTHNTRANVYDQFTLETVIQDMKDKHYVLL